MHNIIIIHTQFINYGACVCVCVCKLWCLCVFDSEKVSRQLVSEEADSLRS